MASKVSMCTATSCAGLLLLCFAASLCWGHQHYRSRLPNSAIVVCPPDNPGCDEGDLCEAIGHMSCSGGGERNAFGKDFEAAGKRWTSELCLKDSDGDGFSNGYELGDPCCIWHEGAHVPQWMLDWSISHPGFEKSTQIKNEVNLAEFCKDKDPLESSSFYNEGEKQIPVEHFVKKHTIPDIDTAYLQFRFNFPDDDKYDLVGMEALVDNEEFVHHYTVNTCTEQTEEEGVILEGADMIEDCQEIILIWTPGTNNLTFPKNTGLSVGKGTKRLGYNLEIHYDNPELKKGEVDASGLRFHFTNTRREHEIGILWSGTIISVGAIPPKKKFYSSTVAQIPVDEEIAPDGINVFGFTPHMHYLGKRMWSETLRRPDEDGSDMLTDLATLEKVRDFARDDSWDFSIQFQGRIPDTKIQDGDYLSTTCFFDAADRDEVTIGGLGTFDEMCINFLYYYPAEAIDSQVLYSGPRYMGDLSDEEFRSLNSFPEILSQKKVNSALPKWRQAYLKGDLTCDESLRGHDLYQIDFITKYDTEWKAAFNAGFKEACGIESPFPFLNINDTQPVECTPECVAYLYNTMGCTLMRDAVRDGKVMPLVASPQEANFDHRCSEAFEAFYEKKEGAASQTSLELMSSGIASLPIGWRMLSALVACATLISTLVF